MTTISLGPRDPNTNLQVLQRIDPNVHEVLSTAGHVCIYVFQEGSQSWVRKDVEGSLFIVKRRVAPRFALVVMNRLSDTNLVQEVDASFEFDIRDPYLIFRAKAVRVKDLPQQGIARNCHGTAARACGRAGVRACGRSLCVSGTSWALSIMLN